VRAAIWQGPGEMTLGTVPDPVCPRDGVLLKVTATGICGTDVHIYQWDEWAQKTIKVPMTIGHEFVGEIMDYGPSSRRPFKAGTKVTAIPAMRLLDGSFGIVGYTNDCPGGFGRFMLLDEDFLLDVPDELDNDLAALIEPLAVGIEHARAGKTQPGEIPLVLGCGAIGLGVIAGLKIAGISPIVAADFDANRRAMALKMGADIVVDPREQSPYAPFSELGGRAPNVVFECVGKAGILSTIMGAIVPGGRIVVGGYCLDPEQVYVPVGQMKGIQINFGGGEEMQDMIAARDAIATGAVDLRPWLGPNVGLGGVAQALKDLPNPASPIRTVVDPWRD